jgi:putative flippase GtrA
MLKKFFPNGEPSWDYIWSEVWSLFKFGVVGATSFLLNVLLYAFLSRYLWVNGSRTIQAVLAVCIASVYNFMLHGAWTFKARAFNASMMMRYVVVFIIGSSLYGVFFHVGTVVFHIYDFLVVAGSTVLVSLVTYGLHRWYTFHPRFDKSVPKSNDLPVS